MNLQSKIEGILFYTGEEISVWKLAQLLNVAPEEIDAALIELEKSLEGRGLVLVKNEGNVKLGISKEVSPIIESMRKDEITRELSKAALETLSIILYKSGAKNKSHGITRSEIDYIRGVNSSFILRNLLVRGLIEKIPGKNDSRRLLYFPTMEVLAFMGITAIDQLPNFEKVSAEIDTVINQSKDEN